MYQVLSSCIERLIDTFDINLTAIQAHCVEVQFIGSNLLITEMGRIGIPLLTNAEPLPLWVRCSFQIAQEVYRMVL